MRSTKHLIFVGLLGLTLAGCSAVSKPLALINGIHERDDGASAVTCKGPISRMDYDGWRTAKRLGWAMPYPLKPDAQGHYVGQGLVPDGRLLILEASPKTDDDTAFDVKIKIGNFGDPQRQAQFLTQLLKVLAMDPMPKRGLNFSLDDKKADTAQDAVTAP